MNRVVLVLVLVLAAVAVSVAEVPKPVFVHEACDSKISSAMLFSLREEIHTSQRYQLVNTLDEDGRMGIVLTIFMNCAERNDVIGVATSYGLAKCYGEKNCHLSVDGDSIKSALCDASAPAECGRALFKSFDDYMKSPHRSMFKLN
jgi:hypothetical protein